MVRLRGKFVEVNPQEWRERTDLTVRVGLGTGNEQEKREKLLIAVSLPEKLGQAFGNVGPKEGYAMFSDIMETLGFDMPEKYAMSPDSPEYQQAMLMKQQQPTPNPIAEAEQVKGQMMLQREQMDKQFEQHKLQMTQQFEAWKIQQEMQKEIALKQQDIQSKEGIEMFKVNSKREDDMRAITSATSAASIPRRRDADARDMRDMRADMMEEYMESKILEKIQEQMNGISQQMATAIELLSSKVDAQQTVAIKPIRDANGRLAGGIQVKADGTEVPIKLQ
jgi:hypothetical protein